MFTNTNFAKIFYKHQRNKKPKSTIEIGAYDADFSVEMRKFVDLKNIWAIEANPAVHEKFKETLSDINYVNLAISDKDGYIDLNIINAPQDREDWWVGASSILDRNDNMGTKSVKVKSMSLDSFVKNNNIKGPISLWIDAEGANREILTGSTETLKNVISIYIEVELITIWENQWLKEDVVSFLSKHGFILLEESVGLQKDIIFIRK